MCKGRLIPKTTAWIYFTLQNQYFYHLKPFVDGRILCLSEELLCKELMCCLGQHRKGTWHEKLDVLMNPEAFPSNYV